MKRLSLPRPPPPPPPPLCVLLAKSAAALLGCGGRRKRRRERVRLRGWKFQGRRGIQRSFGEKPKKNQSSELFRVEQTYRCGEIYFLITCDLNWRMPPSTLGVDSPFSRLPPLKVKSPPPPLSFVLQSTLPQPASFSAAAFSPSPARGWKKREGGGFWLGAGGGSAPIGK